MRNTKFVIGLAAVAGVVITAAGVATAQDPIAARKAIMKDAGAANKVVTGMVKGETPFDAKQAAEAMTKMAAAWAPFAKLFPDNSKTGGETTAAPKIWETRADFDAKGAAMVKAAEAARDAAAKGLDAFKVAAGEVGKTCGGCHKDYRIQKK